MPTRNGRDVGVRYLRLDLRAAAAAQAPKDLLSVAREVDPALDLGVKRDKAASEAVVKVVYPPTAATKIDGWLARATWRDAVLQVTDWTARDAVRALVRSPAWEDEPKIDGARFSTARAVLGAMRRTVARIMGDRTPTR